MMIDCILKHFSSLENCPEMTVTLTRVLADGGEQKHKLTTKVHCATYDVCYVYMTIHQLLLTSNVPINLMPHYPLSGYGGTRWRFD